MKISKVKRLYVVKLSRVTHSKNVGLFEREITSEPIGKLYLAEQIIKDAGWSYETRYYKLVNTKEKFFDFNSCRKALGDVYVRQAFPIITLIKDNVVFDKIKFDRKTLLLLEDYINTKYNERKGDE